MKVIILLMVMVIALATFFLAITITWARKRHDNTANVETKICTECTDLLTRREMMEGKIPGDVERLMSKEDNKICCGDGKKMFALAVRKTVKDKVYEQKIEKVSVEALCQTQDPPDIPHARIAGVVGFLPTLWPGFQRLVWNKNNHTRTSGGLQHLDMDGEVFIRKAGKYFVSIHLNLVSNFSFLDPVDDLVTVRMSVLSHKLGATRVVLESRRSLLDENPWSKPVQFGALFYFYEYDRLSVSISHPSLIALNSFSDQFMIIFYRT